MTDINELCSQFSTTLTYDDKTYDDLNILRGVFENKEAQKGLVALYAQSQIECTRNGKCGMEVGIAREKDQGAILKYFLGNNVNLNLDNKLPEDYVVGNSKISAKHSCGKVGTAVKVKWTSADKSVQEAITEIINAKDDYYPHVLITYINIRRNIINVICVTAYNNKYVIKKLKTEAFNIPKNNSRGIEYSKKAMSEFIKNAYFNIEIHDAVLTSAIHPIERRMKILRKMRIKQ